MTVALLPIREATYEHHALHDSDRCWTETNCYIDVWIEVLHALGLEPAAAGAFTLSADFLGDQWTFFKYPLEDLRALYGIEVMEMNVWRPLIDHIAEQLALGRLMSVEADSYYLPDTAGVAYRERHQKSTIVPQMLDPDGRCLGYFHNAGYFELSGEDFVGALGLDRGPEVLPPYVELIRLERVWHDDRRLAEVARALLVDHLRRRPADNPLRRLSARVEVDLDWLRGAGLASFHDYAFGTVRQCGGCAEAAAAFLSWFGTASGEDLSEAEKSFMAIATGAKSIEFSLARVATGRRREVREEFEELARSWQDAMDLLEKCYGP